MNKLPWVPLYGRDMILDDKFLSLSDDRMKWWFVRLLIHQWDHGFVPLSSSPLRSIVTPCMGTPAKIWHSFVETLPTLFPAVDEYLGQNQRLEEIRAEHVGAQERRTERARSAAQARHKQGTSSAQALLNPANQNQNKNQNQNSTDTDVSVVRKTDNPTPSARPKTQTPVQRTLEVCAAEWARRFGNPSYGRIAKAVKELHKNGNHPLDRIEAHWIRYLDEMERSGKQKLANPQDFASKFKLYAPPVPAENLQALQKRLEAGD